MTNYSDDLIDEKFARIADKLDDNHNATGNKIQNLQSVLERIEAQTTDHNHRMTKLERWILILGTATLVIIALKLPELLPLLKLI